MATEMRLAIAIFDGITYIKFIKNVNLDFKHQRSARVAIVEIRKTTLIEFEQRFHGKNIE